MVAPADATDVLIVDPIDGTRPAIAGLDRRAPAVAGEFERVGGGEVRGNSPYDLAAPWLCLHEAGSAISDGWGEPLNPHRLLGSGHEFQMSSISACNRELRSLCAPWTRASRGWRPADVMRCPAPALAIVRPLPLLGL